ncbi:type II and III secretion system protein family protein [uncultured Hyphomicrobium sp.]|uniref:type II and III secretion system protein family protein n=1 Tax=uncultured Hyphomicrobium sp. TaxID=194373 RepID=UPI0025F495AA|nr:type II and III secretion system protein family protein [uncultured Hyphomicrobium sp.]
MRKNLTSAAALCAALIACLGFGAPVRAEPDGASVMRISARGDATQSRSIALGAGKSMLVEFDFELRDVLVSDPKSVDAIVQTSNRVFLIAKKPGQTNAFFFDSHGQQILTLDITVGADVRGLETLLTRLIPGSNIRVEMAGKSIVLIGTVRTPVDSNRATDIARAFAASNSSGFSSEGASQQAASSSGSMTIINSSDKTQGSDAGGGGEQSKAVINLLGVEGEEQVMLRVTVAEVQRELLKQFGINLAASVNAGNFTWNLLTANALPLTTAAGLGQLPVPGFDPDLSKVGENACAGTTCFYNEGPTSNTFGNSGTTSGWTGSDGRIQKAMRALERDGLVRTLAEPNLTAISGESAKFLAGGEYPIPVKDSNGQTSITYKEFGVGVSFTPIVLSEGRISLKIESEVSELSNAGAIVLDSTSIPALKKRQANSTVELPSGGSIALAGLISDDVRQNIDGFPGLKDVPVLGTLFRSRDFQKRETELVVIVTPYLVKPVAPKDLAKPLDGLAESTDRKANFMGHLNRIYGTESAAPVGDLKGDYGFIVE